MQMHQAIKILLLYYKFKSICNSRFMPFNVSIITSELQCPYRTDVINHHTAN